MITSTDIATASKLLTADDLYRLPDDGSRHELVKGKLITMPPPALKRSIAMGKIGFQIGNFIEEHGLPYLGGFQAAAYITQNPDTVRAADYGIYHRQDLPDPLPDCYYIPGLIPELVVEVIAPGYSAAAITRVRMWQDAGVRLVVMAYIADRAIDTYAADGTERHFAAGDTLTLEPALPGFAVPVADIFRFLP